MSYPPRDAYHGYQQHYAHYPAATHQAPADSTSSLAANSYSTFAPAPQPQQQQSYQPSTRSARSSHSPVSDDGQKPSLPSISNLFGMVDGERSSKEQGVSRSSQLNAHSVFETNDRLAASKNAQSNHAQAVQAQSQSQSQPQPQHQPQPQQYTTAQPPQHVQQPQQSQQHVRQPPHFQHHMQPQIQHGSNAPRTEPTMQMASYPPHDASGSQRSMITPTPPMRTDSIGESTHSPSTISTGSSLSGQPYFMGSALNNVDADQQRATIPQLHKRPSVAHMHPQTSPYGTSPYATSAYSASPGAMSNPGSSFYSPNQPGYPVGAVYSQRPLPTSFPPPPHSAPAMPATNPWEHHHYIGPSSHSTYPQTQERYICPTCNKAFSRPSSLKIHSHSHTGEKPFKCPHVGCGKAFSVRSNMKRHERGCHTGAPNMMGSASHMSQ